MGGISKISIQWEFETKQALSLKLDLADVYRFFSVLEESSALKPLFHSVVAAELELELRLRNRCAQIWLGISEALLPALYLWYCMTCEFYSLLRKIS